MRERWQLAAGDIVFDSTAQAYARVESSSGLVDPVMHPFKVGAPIGWVVSFTEFLFRYVPPFFVIFFHSQIFHFILLIWLLGATIRGVPQSTLWAATWPTSPRSTLARERAGFPSNSNTSHLGPNA